MAEVLVHSKTEMLSSLGNSMSSNSVESISIRVAVLTGVMLLEVLGCKLNRKGFLVITFISHPSSLT